MWWETICVEDLKGCCYPLSKLLPTNPLQSSKLATQTSGWYWMYWFNPQWSSKVRLVQLNNLIAIWRSSGDWRRVNDECPQSTAPLWRCDGVSWGKVMKRSESWHSFIINYRHRNQRQLERKRSGSRIDTQVFTIPRPLSLRPIFSKEKEKYWEYSTWKRNEPAGSEEKLAMNLLQCYII